ncbi:hypothetical protein AVEN_181415-1, partial [Araneus ventricosus]
MWSCAKLLKMKGNGKFHPQKKGAGRPGSYRRSCWKTKGNRKCIIGKALDQNVVPDLLLKMSGTGNAHHRSSWTTRVPNEEQYELEPKH